MELPDPKVVQQHAVESMRLLLFAEIDPHLGFETQLAARSADKDTLVWTVRNLAAVARKFAEDRAKLMGVTTEELLRSYVENFNNGHGWPLEEYMD